MTSTYLNNNAQLSELSQETPTFKTDSERPLASNNQSRTDISLYPFLQCLQNDILSAKNNHNSQQPSNQPAVIAHKQHKLFCKSFKTLNFQEKQNIFSCIQRQLKSKNVEKTAEKQYNQQQTFQCQIGKKGCVILSWSPSKITINRRLKKLMLNVQDSQVVISLREFIVRRSKVHKNCFAFQTTTIFQSTKITQIRIRFPAQNSDSELRFHALLTQIIASVVAQTISSKANAKDKHQKALIKNRNRINVFLNEARVKKLQRNLKLSGFSTKYSRALQSQFLNEQYSTSPEIYNLENYVLVKKQDNTELEVMQTDKCQYRMKMVVGPQNSMSFGNFLYLYSNTHAMIYGSTILQSRRKEQSRYIRQAFAIHHKFTYNSRIFEQVMIGQQSGETQLVISRNKDMLIFTLIDVDHASNLSFIEYLQVTAKELANNQLQVLIYAKFYKHREFDQKAYQSYLYKFKSIFEGVSLMASNCLEEKLIKSEIMKVGQGNKRSILFASPSFSNKMKLISKSSNSSNSQEQSISYLKCRHKLLPSTSKTGTRMTEHFLWKNWRRDANGGLVCADDQLVARQKQIAKIIMKKFGQQILKGKNIINFSLPVVVFKKESHLESIARSQLYAPVFIERAANIQDPLERMKNSIIIMMTENALSIHMEKPFNPILGETYQGWVDGCPIYLEQISHHPPVSAYYMVGRGYKKYGSIQPKISFGLNINKASGYSSNPHYVEFDDGMKIEYICAKMAIGGLLVGQRTFTFQDKTYIYDRKHRYFASMKFGPVDHGFFSSNSQPADYFHGFIYQVTDCFQKYFDSLIPHPHPQPSHIVKTLAEFDGIWNSYVNVNKQRVVDFRTDLPYQFQIEKHPIASDSRYRKDLIDFLRGEMETAQESKEVMEEQQRRDAKLRDQFKAKSTLP